MDIEKFIKVLGMTGSTHDGEALAALRTAQRMMAAAKVSWADLLKRKIESTHTPPNPQQYSDIFRQAKQDPYYQATTAAWEAAQKAKAKKSAYETAAEYEELIRRYQAQQKTNSQRSPGFADDLYEAVFGKKKGK